MILSIPGERQVVVKQASASCGVVGHGVGGPGSPNRDPAIKEVEV